MPTEPVEPMKPRKPSSLTKFELSSLGAGEQSAEFRDHFAQVEIQQAIFDEIRAHGIFRAGNFQLEARFCASHFITHRAQGLVVVLGSLCGVAGAGENRYCEKSERRDRRGALHS
jgi:hypothetical protein